MGREKAGLGAALIAAWFWFSVPIHAQMGANPSELKLGRISYQLTQLPDYYRTFLSGTALPASALSARWLQVEVQFESRLDWIDELQIKYYVLFGRGPDARLFKGEMTHVNVQRGYNHYSAMFMQPNTVEEYGHGQVEAVAAQLFYKGRLVDQDSMPATRPPWWDKNTAVQGFLLSPQQTPWSLIGYSRYEAVKATP